MNLPWYMRAPLNGMMMLFMKAVSRYKARLPSCVDDILDIVDAKQVPPWMGGPSKVEILSSILSTKCLCGWEGRVSENIDKFQGEILSSMPSK
jgi:hypothetical protein